MRNKKNWKLGNLNQKMGFQHWWLINYVQAKESINPGGPTVVKLPYFFGGAVEVV